MTKLLKFMRTVEWRLVDADTRFTLLHQINGGIISLREREGKLAFDDPLPGEQSTLFLIARTLLSGTSRETPAG
jgi:hypothetical protein